MNIIQTTSSQYPSTISKLFEEKNKSLQMKVFPSYIISAIGAIAGMYIGSHLNSIQNNHKFLSINNSSIINVNPNNSTISKSMKFYADCDEVGHTAAIGTVVSSFLISGTEFLINYLYNKNTPSYLEKAKMIAKKLGNLFLPAIGTYLGVVVALKNKSTPNNMIHSPQAVHANCPNTSKEALLGTIGGLTLGKLILLMVECTFKYMPCLNSPTSNSSHLPNYDPESLSSTGSIGIFNPDSPPESSDQETESIDSSSRTDVSHHSAPTEAQTTTSPTSTYLYDTAYSVYQTATSAFHSLYNVVSSSFNYLSQARHAFTAGS